MQDVQPTRLTAYVPKEYFYDASRTLQQDTDGARDRLREFMDWLRSVPDDALHRAVAPGKWSPAEYADHVARANWLFARRLREHRPGEPLEDVGFGAMFPDGRVIAHAGTEPMPGRDREALLSDLQDSARALEDAVNAYLLEGRLDEPCMPHQYFGPLTARETMRLAMTHYERHLSQLRP